ncbi:MAG: Ig-like domain-containing protein [Gemmatimonadales bacterium]
MRSLGPPVGKTTLALFAAAAVAAVSCSSNNAENNPPTASAVAVVSGSAQVGQVGSSLSAPLIVKVTDQNGNPISGVTVTFSASGGSTLSTTTETTDASGIAESNLTIGTTAGPDTVTAMVSGVSTPAIFTLTANAGAAASIAVVAGNNQSGTAGTALSEPLVVEVKDQYDNDVSGATVDWTTSAGLLTGETQSTTGVNGQAQTMLQLPATAGAVTVTATLHSTDITAVFTETAM